MILSREMLVLAVLVIESLVSWASVRSENLERRTEAQCSPECSVTGLQKLYFLPSSTYIYTYGGRSEVTMEGVPGATVNLEWEIKVHLNWVTPCDVIMVLDNYVVNGKQSDERIAEFHTLMKYPIAATISEGVVHGVCGHPLESPESLNFKKGILSAFQNVLPSLSKIHSGRIFDETDAVGTCPTHYTIESTNSGYLITKEKNHLECSERLPRSSNSLINILLLKSPSSILTSSSKCVQEIRNGVIKSVNCEDIKEIRPLLNSLKYVRTRLTSYLTLKNRTKLEFSELNAFYLRRTSLLFETVPQPPSPENVLAATRVLEYLCTKTSRGVHKDVPSIVNKLINLLKKVPTEDFIRIFGEVEDGKICATSSYLKNLFKDIIAFVEHEAALKIMVEQIIRGKLMGFRKELYITSIFLRNTASIQAIAYLKPAFEFINVSPSLALASGRIVKLFCEHNSDCIHESSVLEILNHLGQEIQLLCSKNPLTSDEKRRILTVLKSVGNIGHMNDLLERNLFQCINSTTTESIVKVTAIQAFRSSPCSVDIADKFYSLTLNESEETEPRIFGFIQAMRCANPKWSSNITKFLFLEKNVEVQSFIVSTLKNALNDPLMRHEKMKSLLQEMEFPENNDKNSRCTNFGYFLHTFGIGLNSEINMIYDIKSLLRLYEMHFQIVYSNEVHNVLEISSRLENMPVFKLFKNCLRERNCSFFNTSLINYVIRSIVFNSIINGNENKMADIPDLKDKVDSKNNGKTSEWDIFVRVFGTEVLFISIANSSGIYDPIDRPIYEDCKLLSKHINITNFNTTRGLYADSNLYIPTAQGIPVLIKSETTVVFGLNIFKTPKYSIYNNVVKDLEIVPAFQGEVQNFIGHSFGVESGIGNRFQISLSDDFKTQISKFDNMDIVSKFVTPGALLNIFDMETDTYLVKERRGDWEQKIDPQVLYDPRIKKTSCLPSQLTFSGIKLCWKFDIPNILTSSSLPFGNPARVVAFLQMKDSSTKSFVLDSNWKIDDKTNCLQTKLKTKGTITKNVGEIECSLRNKNGYKVLEIFVAGEEYSFQRGVKISFEDDVTSLLKRKCIAVYWTESREFSTHRKVMSISYEERGDNSQDVPKIDFEMKTLNKLRDFLNADIEVEVDIIYKEKDKDSKDEHSLYFLPVPLKNMTKLAISKSLEKFESLKDFQFPFEINVHKIEIVIGSGEVQTKAFLRRFETSKRELQYRFVTELDSGKALGGAKVTGDVAYTGKPDETVISSRFTGKFGKSHEFRLRGDFKQKSLKTFLKITADNVSQRSKLGLIKISKMKKLHPNITFLIEAQFEVHGYIPYYHMEGIIAKLSAGTYGVNLDLQRDEHSLAKIEGPVSIHNTEENIDLSVTVLNKESYHVTAQYSHLERNWRVYLNLNNSMEQMFLLNLFNSKPSSSESVNVCSVFLSRLMNLKFRSESSERHFDSSLWLKILPESEFQRILKGNIIIDYLLKKFQGKIRIKDLLTEKFIVATTSYNASLPQRYLKLQGDVKMSSEKYFYEIGVNLGSPEGDGTYTRLFAKVTPPLQGNFIIDAVLQKEAFGKNIGDRTAILEITTLAGNRYRIGTNYCYAIDLYGRGFQIAGHTNVTLPQSEDIVLKVDTSLKLAESLAHILLKNVNVEDPRQESKEQPEHRPRKYGSMEHVSTKLASIDEFIFRIEAILPPSKNITLSFEGSHTPWSISFTTYENSKSVLHMESYSLNDYDWIFKASAKDKGLELSSKVIYEDVSLTLYPNKEWECPGGLVGGRYIRGTNFVYERHAIWTLFHDRYPGKRTPELLSNEAFIPQKSISRTIDLKTADGNVGKIFLSGASIKLTEGSYKTELIFNANWLPVFPRILIESSFSGGVKSVTMSIQKEVSSPPLLSVSGTILSGTMTQRSLYAFVKTQKRESELAATLSLRDDTVLVGTVRSPSQGTYDFSSRYCSPATVEIGAKSREESVCYVTSLAGREDLTLIGVQQRTTSCSYEQENSNKYIASAFVGLISSTILEFDIFYSLAEMVKYLDHVYDGFEILQSLCSETFSNIEREMMGILANEDSNEVLESVAKVYSEIRSQIRRIQNDVTDSIYISSFSKFTPEMMNKFTTEIVKPLMKNIDDIKKLIGNSIWELMDRFYKGYDKVENYLRLNIQHLVKRIEDIKNSLWSVMGDSETAETIIKYLRPSSIWKLLKKLGSFVRKNYYTELDVLQQIISGVKVCLQQEMEHLWNLFLKSKYSLLRLRQAFFEWLAKESSSVSLLRSIFNLNVGGQEESVSLRLPLKSPAYSLASSWKKIGIPEYVSSDYFEIQDSKVNIEKSIRRKRLDKK